MSTATERSSRELIASYKPAADSPGLGTRRIFAHSFRIKVDHVVVRNKHDTVVVNLCLNLKASDQDNHSYQVSVYQDSFFRTQRRKL